MCPYEKYIINAAKSYQRIIVACVKRNLFPQSFLKIHNTCSLILLKQFFKVNPAIVTISSVEIFWVTPVSKVCLSALGPIFIRNRQIQSSITGKWMNTLNFVIVYNFVYEIGRNLNVWLPISHCWFNMKIWKCRDFFPGCSTVWNNRPTWGTRFILGNIFLQVP